MTGALEETSWAIAASLANSATQWSMVIAPQGQRLQDAAVAIETDLADMLGGERKITVLHAISADQIERSVTSGQVWLIVPEMFGVAEWQRFDVARERISAAAGSSALVIVVSRDSAGHLAQYARNVHSFASSSTYWMAARHRTATPEAVAERLEVLRGSYGMTDDELIRMALSGSAPAEPEVAEWLTLIGRGDLLGGRGE